MNEDFINNPENFCLSIRGKFNRPDAPPLIFQKSHGRQQKKTGPIIPANPQTQKQQLYRIRFLAAHRAAQLLTPQGKAFYASLINPEAHSRNWYHEFMSRAAGRTSFNDRRFGEGCFRGNLPNRPAHRMGTVNLGDGFFSRLGDVPADVQPIAEAFPNINTDNL